MAPPATQVHHAFSPNPSRARARGPRHPSSKDIFRGAKGLARILASLLASLLLGVGSLFCYAEPLPPHPEGEIQSYNSQVDAFWRSVGALPRERIGNRSSFEVFRLHQRGPWLGGILAITTQLPDKSGYRILCLLDGLPSLLKGQIPSSTPIHETSFEGHFQRTQLFLQARLAKYEEEEGPEGAENRLKYTQLQGPALLYPWALPPGREFELVLNLFSPQVYTPVAFPVTREWGRPFLAEEPQMLAPHFLARRDSLWRDHPHHRPHREQIPETPRASRCHESLLTPSPETAEAELALLEYMIQTAKKP